MGRFPIHIASLGRQVEILSKAMDNVETQSVGENYFSFFRGSGLEFKGYREYTPGEDSKNIDWKASLRSDKLLVKEFLQEKGLDVVFVYDVSETMLFGSKSKIKAHYGAEFILTLASTALDSNYNVGLLCFSDKVKEQFFPASSENQIAFFLDVLSNHSTYGGEFDLTKALEFIDATYSAGSVVILVSDFLGSKFPLEHYKDKFKQLAIKFDLISVVLRDKRDEFMPDDNINVVVSNPFDGGHIFFNTKKIKKKYEKYTKKQKVELRNFFEDINSEYIELYTDIDFVNPTVAFFKRRDALSK